MPAWCCIIAAQGLTRTSVGLQFDISGVAPLRNLASGFTGLGKLGANSA